MSCIILCIRLTIFYQRFSCFFQNRYKSLLKQTGPRLRPESRRENYLKDRPSCPPTTDPGLMPEARRENYLNDHKLSSDDRQWINTRCTTGKISTFLPTTIPSEQSARRTILTPSYYQQQLQCLAYDSVALDGILSPSPTTYQQCFTFRMLHIWLKINANQ